MKRKLLSTLSLLSLFISTPVVLGEETAKEAKSSAKEVAAKDNAASIETVDIFQAMDEGVIEVNFVPKDATQATIIIKNKGDEAIDVKIPAAFGAVHILGQMGMGGMGGGMMGGMGGGMGGMGGGMGGMGGGMGGMGGGQGMGGGMGGMGGGMGGMGGGMGGMGGGMGGMGGGMFRVEPDKTRKMTVPCVCLEHGKVDPNPRMKYKMVPLEQVNKDPRVEKLCALLGEGRIAQNTVQAAAWHMANGLSWQELAVKNRIESKYTGNVRFFNPVELRSAFQVANVIESEYQRYISSIESSSSESESQSESGSGE